MTSSELSVSLPKNVTTGLTWDKLLQIVHQGENVPERVEPPLPKHISFSTEQIAALHELADSAADWSFPHAHRKLTAAEKEHLQVAMENVLGKAKAAVAAADAQVKRAWHNHFDKHALADGKVSASTMTHKENGWYCVEDKNNGVVEGADQKVVREVSGGGPSLTEGHLRAMEHDGVITHEEYLAFTNQVRVVNEAAILQAAADRGVEFGRKLINYAERAQPTLSIRLRPNK